YGIIAWSVTQRTREVGIRMALGSTRSNVTALILGDSMKLTMLGVAIGIAGALALTRVVAGLLYEVSAFDAMTFVSAPLMLAGVGFVASWIPARRAAKVDPAIAMRAD